jgi:hypothetical protein
MLSILLAGGIALYASLHFLLLPLIYYFRDPKGLRRYPNLSFFSAISDWPYYYLSACGFRSKDLTKIHKERNAPVLRIGPNNLSFSHVAAVRDIYGHSTTCVKNVKYSMMGGEHPNLSDVVDKTNHSIKRKRLSAAFAIKNLVRWEHKVARTTS